MVDSTGRSLPSALVPLCAYQGKVIGPDMPGYNFSYCDLFEPDVLEGKLCYSMNLTKLTHGFAETKMGKSQGLLLVIDVGAVLNQNTENAWKLTTDIINQNIGKQKVEISQDIESAEIHIQTLEKIKDSRAGFYALTSLKKITGTESFLDLPDHQKHCQLDTFENCSAKRYFEEVRSQCHCVPWTLGTNNFDQVNVACSQGFFKFIFQDLAYCTMAEESCVLAAAEEKKENDCLVGCTGLYADVNHTPDLSLYHVQNMVADGELLCNRSVFHSN